MSRSFSHVLCVVLTLLSGATIAAAEVSGIVFDDAPGDDWRCGLSNDDFPGLTVEGMTQPLAAGCIRGDARAYVVVVDLSASRSAMTADQMASAADEQLPSTWKVDSTEYDVITLPSGYEAAYARLIGRGDGFTFLSGQKPMVAISANVSMRFEDASRTPRQIIAVFRVRAPLPGGAARKERIAELDRMLRAWAASARPASGSPISERDFELAAYARARKEESTESQAPQPGSSPGPASTDRIANAIVAAATDVGTPDDALILEEAAKAYGSLPLAKCAGALATRIRDAQRWQEQQQIISAALAAAKNRAIDVYAAFVSGLPEDADAATIEWIARTGRERGWTVRTIGSPAARSLAAAVLSQGNAPIADVPDVRAFFESTPAELLSLVGLVRPVPLIDTVARAHRDAWRLQGRHTSALPTILVRQADAIGVLERQNDGRSYRFRQLTNLLDVPRIVP